MHILFIAYLLPQKPNIITWYILGQLFFINFIYVGGSIADWKFDYSLSFFSVREFALSSMPPNAENCTTREAFGLPFQFKDVRAHCYCASLVRTLFIGHARATSFSSARTDSKTQQNIEWMIFALTWCANIFVGCSVTPTFFSADHFLF